MILNFTSQACNYSKEQTASLNWKAFALRERPKLSEINFKIPSISITYSLRARGFPRNYYVLKKIKADFPNFIFLLAWGQWQFGSNISGEYKVWTAKYACLNLILIYFYRHLVKRTAI